MTRTLWFKKKFHFFFLLDVCVHIMNLRSKISPVMKLLFLLEIKLLTYFIQMDLVSDLSNTFP